MFDPGFSDRASKIVETEKAFDKVSDSGPFYKRRQMENSEIFVVFYPEALLPSTVAGKSSATLSHTISRNPKPSPRAPSTTTGQLTSRPLLEGIICGRRSESLPRAWQGITKDAGGSEGVSPRACSTADPVNLRDSPATADREEDRVAPPEETSGAKCHHQRASL